MYVHTRAWYERLEKWVGKEGQLDAGYRLFEQFTKNPDLGGNLDHHTKNEVHLRRSGDGVFLDRQ